MLKLDSPLVSVEWLNEHKDVTNLIILDASIKKVTGKDNTEPETLSVPNSRFFDIKNNFSDTDSPFPNTLPSSQKFETEARVLGINRNSAIIVYDDKGIYSSARAWFMFKVFGHDNVAVLDGGLPLWKKMGYELEERTIQEFKSGDFIANYKLDMMRFFEDVKFDVSQEKSTILDARSSARFLGEEPEPRKGLRSGTIPHSKSLPYSTLMENGKFKDREELAVIFNTFAKQEDALIFSCGSGITACVLALGAELSGYEDYSVYDGSWTEWGTLVSE